MRFFRTGCASCSIYRTAGLKGAQKKWQSHSEPNGTAVAKESKGNVIEVKVKENDPYSNTGISQSFSPSSLRTRALYFNESLQKIIRPRSQSDRTCFKNITGYLVQRCEQGRDTEKIFDAVLSYAYEAAKAGRNPAAVFVSILKKELGYAGLCKPGF